MILKSFELGKIKLIKSNLILVYGENQGYKTQVIKEVFEKPFNGEILRFDEHEILNNQEEFISSLLNKSLFDDEKLIIITRSTDKVLKFINDIRERNIQKIKVVINSNNLDKKSKLRTLFEKEKDLVCIPFYEDNDKSLSIIAQNYFAKEKIKISQEIINLLISRSRGDRGNLDNELNKIANLIITKKNINIEEILKLTNLSENYGISELADNCLAKNLKKINKIFNENVFSTDDCILIIRTLLLKSKRLLEIKKIGSANKNLDEVISNYKPPIFWKDKQIVKNQVLKWTLSDSENLIRKIYETELNIKKNYTNSLNIVSDFIISTAK